MLRRWLGNLFTGTVKLYIWPIVLLILVFWASCILGLLLPVSWKLQIFSSVGEQFDTIVDQGPTNWLLSWAIFRNNLTVSVITYLSGFVLLGPILVMIMNGTMIGVFMSLIYRSDVLEPGNFMSGMVSLIPHGIFELSAFFISGALSMIVIMKAMLNDRIEPHKTRRQVLAQSGMRFMVIVIPLLIIAAFVEVYVSEHVGNTTKQLFYDSRFDQNLAINLPEDFGYQYHCQVTTDQESITHELADWGIQESLHYLATILYTDHIYETYKVHRHEPVWATVYSCDDVKLLVQSWYASDWSVSEASTIYTDVLDAVGKTYTPLIANDTQFVARIENSTAETPFTIAIYSQDDHTVSVTISNPTIPLEQILGESLYK